MRSMAPTPAASHLNFTGHGVPRADAREIAQGLEIYSTIQVAFIKRQGKRRESLRIHSGVCAGDVGSTRDLTFLCASASRKVPVSST
jgi:hypothetical protein